MGRVITMGAWRNGSAFDSRSKGWEFKSLRPHHFFNLTTFYFITILIINYITINHEATPHPFSSQLLILATKALIRGCDNEDK